MFNAIAYFFANILLVLYKFVGNQTVLAIAALTVLIRLLILPLTLYQQRSSQKMQEVQPKLDKLRKKYENDQEKLAQEQMKLMREAGVNPLGGGCLPLLIQLPILFGLYRAIQYCVPTTPLQLFQFSAHIYNWLPVEGLVPLESTFLGMDLGQPPSSGQWWSYALPILVFFTSWVQQKILSPSTSSGSEEPSQAELMSTQMQIMMPLMFGFIALQYATGLSIYFIISNLFGIAQFYLIRRSQANGNEESGK